MSGQGGPEVVERRAGSVRRFLDIANNIPDYLLGATLLMIVIIVFLGVFFRYFVGSSLAWADEIARFLLIWLTFLGTGVAVKRSAHYRVDLFIQRLGGRSRRTLELTTSLSVSLFSAILLVQGIQLTIASRETTSPAMTISMAVVYVAIPVGGALMLLYSVSALGRALLAYRGEADHREAPRQ